MAGSVQVKTKRSSVEKGTAATQRQTIGVLLRDAYWAFSHAFRARLVARGVTFGQFAHLQVLWEENGLTQVELSRRIGIERASSTAVIDGLESGGFVRRMRNTEDRRKINIFLTPAGLAIREDLLACSMETDQAARSGLSQMQVTALYDVISQITANLRRTRRDDESRARGGRDRRRAAASAPRTPRRAAG